MKVINCIDISDEFDYEDIFIYDCQMQTSRIHVAVYDNSIGQMKYMNLKDFPLFDDDIEDIVGNVIEHLETDIKIKYSIDTAVVDYELYTFFDFKDDIKFILIIDFSGQDKKHIKYKRKDIAEIQLKGKSKYLN